MDLRNRWMDRAQILGRWEASLREAMSKILEPQTYPINQNRKSRALKAPTRVHPNLTKLSLIPGVWMVKIIHKDAQTSTYDPLKEI
jgi:hypothetical protein